MHILRNKLTQVFVIVLVPNVELFAYQTSVFLFKHLLEYPSHFIAVFIITLVLGYLINEEERQALDTTLEQLAFLLEVRHNGFTNLYPLHVQLVCITYHFASSYGCTIQKGYITIGVDFRYHKVVILSQSRFRTQVITHTKGLYLAYNAARCCFGFYLNACHRRMLGRKHNVIQVQIAACPFQVLHLETLYMNTFHQLLTIGIQGIKSIDRIMLGLVGSRVV